MWKTTYFFRGQALCTAASGEEICDTVDSGLTFMSWNTYNFRRKEWTHRRPYDNDHLTRSFEDQCNFILQHAPDVFCLQEATFTKDGPTGSYVDMNTFEQKFSEYKLFFHKYSRYNLYRVIGVRNTLNPIQEDELTECATLTYSGKKIMVCSVHLPLSTVDKAISRLETHLQMSKSKDNVVIMGDFNYPEYEKSSNGESINSVMQKYKFKNHPPQRPTGIKRGKIIDMIWWKGLTPLQLTPSHQDTRTHTVEKRFAYSDHLPIMQRLKL